ncbi:MAG: hypothetical protein O2794_00660 [bacterium]|nr:hypothetical protein [bacterium]
MRAFLLWGCIGITVEVVFTALVDTYQKLIPYKGNWRLNEEVRQLKGHSYIWMFPMYGAIAELFPYAFFVFEPLHYILRIISYGLVIIGFEICMGWLLDNAFRVVPWRYPLDNKWTVGKGYTRLDYLPFWIVFGAGIEYVYPLV